MRILTILLILILAVGAGYAQTPENMKLRVKVIDAEGKPIPKDAVDRFHILDMSDEPMYTLIVPHDGSVTVVLPTPEKSRPRRVGDPSPTLPATGRERLGAFSATGKESLVAADPSPALPATGRERLGGFAATGREHVGGLPATGRGDVGTPHSTLATPRSTLATPHSNIIPFQICMMLNVPGFGEVAIFADGKGKGYSQAGTIDFATEAAATRLLRVRNALKAAERQGIRMPREFREKLDRAEKLPPYESLAITLAAGEELTLTAARQRIEKLKAPRKDFIFGCNAFGYPARGPLYQERFKEVFNLGITNVYISHFAPTETTRNYDRTDAETEWLLSNGMKVKPCPPFYMAGGVTPQWLRDKPHAEVPKIGYKLVYETVARYKGRTEFCEIMNEAHDHSNALRLSPDELTLCALYTSRAARDADPNVRRIINSCHLWGEYVASRDREGRVKRSPFAYLQDCLAIGAEFEIVGLQLYYPEYDLFEIERLFDRFATLGKPIQITEMGCQSAPGLDPNAQRQRATKGWHGPWTEEMQADWVEAIYTLAYSKPYIEGVSWWDLADAVSFWPYGGLLRGDCSPKPAFERLKALQKKWSVAKQVGD